MANEENRGSGSAAEPKPSSRSTTVPIAEERLELGKQRTNQQSVVVDKTVDEHTETVSLNLESVHADVKRIPINQVIHGALPTQREDGETTIIPVIEERAVVTTQLVLVEEIHVRHERRTHVHEEDVVLRRERVEVSRQGNEPEGDC